MEKKRVLVTADKEAWEGIQKLIKENGIDPRFFSGILNMFLRWQYEELQRFVETEKTKGGISPIKLVQYTGGLVERFEQDQYTITFK